MSVHCPRNIILLLLIGPSLAPVGCTSSAVAKRYLCRRVAGEITIDGRLGDAAWKAAPWTNEFVDIEGASRPAPRYATQVKMLWDQHCFYIAARLEEPHLCATLTEHDAIVFHDNDFEIFIDPDGDARNYYEIEVNAHNTVFDLLLRRTYRDGGPALHEWDFAGLRTAVFCDGTLNDPSDIDRGWTVELALPWEALAEFANTPSPPEDGDTWRVNFSRVQWPYVVSNGRYQKPADAKESNWVWSTQGTVNMHIPQRWGYVTFEQALPSYPSRSFVNRMTSWSPASDSMRLRRRSKADSGQGRRVTYPALSTPNVACKNMNARIPGK